MEWLRYAPRLVFLTLMACLNTIGAACDTLFYGRAIATQELNDEPVFILGHPRTGTTHLHNLLSKDPRFAHATTFSVGFPSGFLCMRRLAPYLGLIMDAKRPMDNMALAWNTPQEDEIAVNQLSAGASPYMPLCFPRREASFRKFYDFRDADEADLTRWKDAFMYFLKKTQFAAGARTSGYCSSLPCTPPGFESCARCFPRRSSCSSTGTPSRCFSPPRTWRTRITGSVISRNRRYRTRRSSFCIRASCCTRRTRVT